MSHFLDSKISEAETTLKQMRQRRRDDLKIARRMRPKKRPGRKPIDPDIIELAKKLGQRKTLTEVALQLDVGLKTLYTHGVSRKALNAEKGL